MLRSTSWWYTYCATALPVNDQSGPIITPIIKGRLVEKDGGMVAEGSSTLVQSKGKNIIFDTSTIESRQTILDSLQQNAGLSAEDIDVIVLSHGHGDHTSNAALFPDAALYSMVFKVNGTDYEYHGLVLQPDLTLRSFLDDPSLELFATVGHTNQDISLAVRDAQGYGTVVLAGDLYYEEDDWQNGMEKEMEDASFDSTKLIASRKAIACKADYIMPGHGAMFMVTPAMKQAKGC